MSATVLVVDDHPVFRAGVAGLLESAGYRVVAQAASQAEALAAARRTRPEIVLMDIHLPDGSGIDATAHLIGEQPDARVIVLTMYDDDGSVREALAAGAVGYVVKDAAPPEILAVVAATAQGVFVLGSGVHRPDGILGARPAPPDPFGLTPRERDVLELVVRGLTNPQIAARLGLSAKTVSNNVSMLLAKCAAADRAELAAIARAAFGR